MELKKYKKLFISALVFALLSSLSFAIEVPALKGRINDYANVIDSDVESKLNNYLSRLETQTGTQLAILTVPTIEDESIESFSMKVADKWQLGQEGKDNGILVTLALEQHEIRIEIGYGLEDILTDAKSGLIIRNAIIPEFKNGDYSQGIYNGVSNIVGLLLDDEELIDEDVFDENHGVGGIVLVFIGIWILFILFIIFAKSGMFGASVPRNPNSGTGGVVAAAVLFDTLNDINRNNSSSSGFSGGGFSGGGGGFGGGGASGHW